MSEYLSPQPPVETLEDRFGPLPEYAREYDRTLRAIRTDEYKLVVGSDGLEQLYHIASDPAERNDRSATEPEQTAQLKQMLDEWLDSFTHADPDTEPEVSSATKARLTDLGYM